MSSNNHANSNVEEAVAKHLLRNDIEGSQELFLGLYYAGKNHTKCKRDYQISTSSFVYLIIPTSTQDLFNLSQDPSNSLLYPDVFRAIWNSFLVNQVMG